MIVNLFLEGALEEHVAVRLLSHFGHSPGDVYGKRGCEYLRRTAYKFHGLVKSGVPMLVLTDFKDAKVECIPEARHEYFVKYIAELSKLFVFRFAVMEIESWIMADRIGFSQYFGINVSRLPDELDAVLEPKSFIVQLASHSRKRNVKRMIIPDGDHGGKVASGYNSLLARFIYEKWNVEEACNHSTSLARCAYHLRELK